MDPPTFDVSGGSLTGEQDIEMDNFTFSKALNKIRKERPQLAKNLSKR
jgi:hypothetical protein